MVRFLGRSWWTLVGRGVVGVLVGAACLVWPGPSLRVLAYLFGVLAVLDGAFSLAAALRGGPHGSYREVLLAEGLLGTSAGILALIWPWFAALTVVFLIAAWAIVTGGLEIAAAARLRREIEGEWVLAICGLLSILLGMGVAVRPEAGAIVLAWLIGIYAIAFGALMLALGFSLRAWLRRIDALGAGAARYGGNGREANHRKRCRSFQDL